MNKAILIKICGIKDPSTAFEAAKMGVDFIGVVFHEHSKRFVHPQMAKTMCEAATNGAAKVVGVFVNHYASEMLSICELTGIKIAQLHGTISKQEAYKLPQNIQRIYTINVDDSGKILDDEDRKNIEHLKPNRDFLLFDGREAGSGKAFAFNRFKYTYDLPFFLAGGLKANNIATAIKIVNPDGVDVSSGVENIAEKKDPQLIQQFIMQVKKREKNYD